MNAKAKDAGLDHPLAVRLWWSFIEFGVPRVFTWIEWAGFLALLRFVGKKYDIPSILMASGMLLMLAGIHISFVTGSGVAEEVIQKGLKKWLSVIAFLLSLAMTCAVGYFLMDLVNALVRAQA